MYYVPRAGVKYVKYEGFILFYLLSNIFFEGFFEWNLDRFSVEISFQIVLSLFLLTVSVETHKVTNFGLYFHFRKFGGTKNNICLYNRDS